MKEIGGYLELELREGQEFHKKAIKLNTGRNALELILKVKQYKKVFIPYYTCDAILEPFFKLEIDYEFYSIDEHFEPIFDYDNIKENEGFLYTNYFGLKDSLISTLSASCKNLIIDNSQAFFALPKSGIPTFYSCRKFFGVPDGAYLYLEGISELEYPYDYSSKRFEHLLKRTEYGAEVAYSDFQSNEECLKGQPILQMSMLSRKLLGNIDYQFVMNRRRNNFISLQEAFTKTNQIKMSLDGDFTPLVFPFLINNPDLRQHLLHEKIFIPVFWPNVLKWVRKESFEYKCVTGMIFLPIDQRMVSKDISLIVEKINKYI
jgi:hypothetical protein